MNLQEFQVRAQMVNKLAAKGHDLIEALEREVCGDALVPFLRINDKRSSTHCLGLSFYGLPLLFRVELKLLEHSATGRITAYTLSYEAEPKETLLSLQSVYHFDELGNVTAVDKPRDRANKFAGGEFVKFFLAEVFTCIASGDYSLRP